jgi:aspartate/methionine/tyrosine aminotransferase
VFSRRAPGDISLNALSQLLERTGPPRCDLTLSNPTRAGLDCANLLEIVARATTGAAAYAPQPFGLQSARCAVAERVFAGGAELAPDDVLLTASTSEAYGYLFKLLCDPGDAVLVPAPSYPLFEHLALLEGIQAVPYRLAYDGAWHIDGESLRSAVTERTRAVIAVSPNNPTGHYLAAEERAQLEALGLPLLVDEVFFEYGWRSGRRVRARELRSASAGLTFSMGGLSKLAGLPQLKLGWTAIDGPEPLRRAARERLELIADSYLSVGTPIQLALPELLASCGSATEWILARCRASLDKLSRALVGTPITLLAAEAGWSAVLRLPALLSEEAWVLGLLREQSVLVQPGWFYDFATEPYVIVSLLTSPDVFEEGIGRLLEHVTRIAG